MDSAAWTCGSFWLKRVLEDKYLPGVSMLESVLYCFGVVCLLCSSGNNLYHANI